MGSLKDEAQAYEPLVTENIASLDKVSVDLDLKSAEGKDKDGNTFTYKYVEVAGKQYRVPGTVLAGIRSVLKKMPHIKEVTVDRSGEGLNTRYNVMPYIPAQVERVDNI